jgi:hypothetical protein
MPEMDHRVRQGFQGIVQLANPFKAHQQTPKLVLPGEDPLDGGKPFLKKSWIENRFAPTLGRLSTAWIFRNIQNHAAIEYSFPVRPTIVDPIQADDGLAQIESDLLGNAGHL